MTTRRLLAIPGLVLALLGATTGGPAAAQMRGTGVPASPLAGSEGECTDDSGVTVVVDFQELGGGIVVRCAGWPLPGNGTGLDALRAAGIPLEGVRRWGNAFICRLYDKPSATQKVPVKNNPGYQERCIDTPPAAAYWSYWHSPNGGSWTYSQFGLTNRKATRGGYEGWSFSLNRTSDTNPVPRLAPSHPVSGSAPSAPSTSRPTSAPGSSAPSAAPGPSGSLAPEPGSGLPGDPAPTDPRGTTGSTPTRGTAAAPGSPGSSGSTDGADAPTAPGEAQGSGGDTPSSASPRSATTTQEDREDLVVDSDDVASGTADQGSDGMSLPVLAGIALLAFFLVMGLGTALRRRRDST